MRNVTWFIVLSFLCFVANANEREKAYELFKAQRTQAYTEFKDARLVAYAEFRSELIKKWGVADTSSNNEMVKYSDDVTKKMIINYEENTLRVQSIEPLTQQEAFDFVQRELAKPLSSHIVELALQETKTTPSAIESLNNTPALGHIASITINDISQLTSESPQESVKEIEARVTKKLVNDIQQLDKIVKITKADASVAPTTAQVDLQDVKAYKKLVKKERNKINAKPVVSYRIDLSEKRLQRAQQYLSYVVTQAKKYNIDPYLILAVIETESSFNPLARSSIPAFGLMQIVPVTAGLDVNQKIFKTTIKPEAELLYIPAENIVFGTAYLHILVNNYFSDVSDSKAKEYCSIAAYNTGIGNVSKVFTGKKAIRAAAEAINRLSPEQVFEKLQLNTVPETQQYLLKVTKRKLFYEHSLPNLKQEL